jgi:hypothetical protein
MKKILATCLIVLGLASFADAAPTNELIDALVHVESKGKVDAIGDNGNAVGCLQIWPSVIQDVNRVYKTKYTLADGYNEAKSRDICKKYLDHYGKSYTKKTKKTPTNEVYARIWNGGPAGYKKTATVKYWNKVRKVL